MSAGAPLTQMEPLVSRARCYPLDTPARDGPVTRLREVSAGGSSSPQGVDWFDASGAQGGVGTGE